MTGIVGGLYSLVLVLANILLQAFFKVLLVFGVLFLIGVLYPFVARVLGLPYMTVWDLSQALWNMTITIRY